jgi:hypothetical protein
MKDSSVTVLAIASAIGALVSSANAAAQVDCNTLPNPVYGIGGSAANVLFRYTAGALRRIPNPITVVYQSPGACTAMGALVNDVPLTGTATYWDENDAPQTCNVPQDTLATWGSMATTAPRCEGITALPATVGDYRGPAYAISLFVPRNTTAQQVISSEALYFVYGFGPAGNVVPWINPDTIFSRSVTSATGLLIALAAGLPTTRPLYTAPGTEDLTGSVVNWVAGVSNPSAVADPDSAIGFASTETVEAQANIPLVRSLAYQHVGQEYGYYPNSTPDSFDKQNVRDGHYHLWTVHHIFARQSSEGVITDEPTRRWVSHVTGQTEIPLQTGPTAGHGSFVDIVISVGNIPDCAFTVTRTGDLGPLASFQPESSCAGYFEAQNTGETTHDECTDDTDCTVPSVQLGLLRSALSRSAPRTNAAIGCIMR